MAVVRHFHHGLLSPGPLSEREALHRRPLVGRWHPTELARRNSGKTVIAFENAIDVAPRAGKADRTHRQRQEAFLVTLVEKPILCHVNTKAVDSQNAPREAADQFDEHIGELSRCPLVAGKAFPSVALPQPRHPRRPSMISARQQRPRGTSVHGSSTGFAWLSPRR
jgi:hypothetical protein